MQTLSFQKLIKGIYEASRFPKDFSPERIVPDFAFNVLNPLGLLYRPVVDEQYLENGGQKPVWPDGKSFAVCLTHDVDFVSNHSFCQSARMLREAFVAKSSFKEIANSGAKLARDVIQSIIYRGKEDPLHCYERWLEAEENVGAKSTFFFWPGWKAVKRHHHTDCTYDMNDRLVFDGQACTVGEMIREISRRGWEIGLHSSWYSFDSVKEMKRQKSALERVLGNEVVSVRQHYLHYDIRVTPRIHYRSGFLYDSTLGFNDNIGFRFGTCHPFKIYDLKAEIDLPVTEIPLIIQDVAMLDDRKGMRLDEDTAFRYVKQITEAVEAVGGVLTLLWHPNAVIDPSAWNLYLRCLDYLKEKNAWFGTVKGIGERIKLYRQGTG